MMYSVFDLFKIGVGPSSSHTVGPMIAAYRFAEQAIVCEHRPKIAGVRIKLYGSLALTGMGHATDIALLAGLSGCLPDRTEPEVLQGIVQSLRRDQILILGGDLRIPFDEATDLVWLRNQSLPQHPNAIDFSCVDRSGQVLLSERYFSTGGGFVYTERELEELRASTQSGTTENAGVPFPFTTAFQLVEMAKASGLRIDEVVHANELMVRSQQEIDERLDRLWEVMSGCIDRGCVSGGLLPGPLKIRRRAPMIFSRLSRDTKELPSRWLPKHAAETPCDPLEQLDWVSLFALAVNEENAAGGRVVTAPTNGAAGIIPAVLSYYVHFVPGADRDGIHRFLKTAGAIGLLYKRNASLSAAEMGCQGEVGVACSMAAAGLAACMNGSIDQIENAAEIGMEHNLGLTCDPIAGLVQVPCIERNTMGATKAINAARLAVLYGDGRHFVSLDRVIETMRQTGVDMQAKYKETSLGGLAVNVVDC
ncbi:MAG: L-serine ammonia-lyase [Pirellula sp.]